MLADQARLISKVEIKNPDGSGSVSTARPAKDVVRQYITLRQTTKLFELCYLVCGQPPSVNLIGHHENGSPADPQVQTLSNPTHVFCGLERPFIRNGADEDVFVYCLNVSQTYKYIPSMVCAAKLVDAPEGCVFVVYLKKSGVNHEFEILNWEWVEHGEDGKPTDWQDRYKKELIL